MTRDLDELDIVDIRARLHMAMNATDPHRALANWALTYGEDLCAAYDHAFDDGASFTEAYQAAAAKQNGITQ